MCSQFYPLGNGEFAISIEPAAQSSQISGLLFFSGEIISFLIELNRFIGFLGAGIHEATMKINGSVYDHIDETI